MRGEEVYRHGVQALFCSIVACGLAVASIHVWQPLLLLALGGALGTGYHAGLALLGTPTRD